MKKIQNQSNDTFFSFLGRTLSFSNLFSDSGNNAAEKNTDEPDTNADRADKVSDYFDFLSGSLSNYTIFA